MLWIGNHKGHHHCGLIIYMYVDDQFMCKAMKQSPERTVWE